MKNLDNYEKELKAWSQHEQVAANSLSIKLFDMFKPKKVIDVGCGSGLFLKPFSDRGCEIFGVDGDVTGGFLLDKSEFKQADLRKEQFFGEFDLAICLEVIEHLQPEYEDFLINTISKSSDIVVFSGAKPGQVGTNHYNCREKKYWIEKFKNLEYEISEDTIYLLDFMRNLEEFKNCPWLEDNIFVAVRNKNG